MKIKPLTVRDAVYTAYSEAITALKRTTWRRPVTTEQAESTKAILEGRSDPNRPMPENWKAVPNAKTWEESVGARTITDYERYNYKWLQHRTEGRNTIGQSMESGIDAEKRLKAANAFMTAVGTGRTYDQLRPEEKARVQNYFLDFLTRALSPEEHKAVKTEDTAKIDQMIAEELKVKVQ